MDIHEKYMQRCLELAVLGAGSVSPNPMVGAVIVVGDSIIGEGYTSPYGGPHAEVNAVRDVLLRFGEERARVLLQESTIYVSLEPCAHHGKTPPCADMLVDAGIKNIYIACQDPFAKVNGEGIRKLKDSGASVHIGLLEQKAKGINRRFFTRVDQHRPYVILKWAETADGYFAPLDNSQKWITNAASKQLVHKWRSEEDAILVGANTALIDNPNLTVREWKGRNPKRILIDKNLSVPPASAIFNTEAETIVFNAQRTDWQEHIKYIALENFDLYLPQNILYQLYLMDVQSVIIEGGVKTLQMFVDAGLWDEARVFGGTLSWGEGVKSPVLRNERLVYSQKVSSDSLKVYEREG
ncbi:bifunctional diaminohydroxyphosphoribosylaminopyrimidine deaminase/5-amino-6-(5-phosphoribosylamino)uracil reductase RibD [Parapedobacter sp. SGR-10]|uniref:bifunctional diaminohydroxyphosphoribosylaminopyrimidine deaminase/5-amino-6-(5-phosphoribosylamino)uracil reductase RibD n=1 Tax=Parapedobacter sp. SGR-10 TaxID=2710879 RepID=UPI0013D2F5AE|nr:bifunctional diaminohydroxyphosphoribosylaminopyrimidine deaminase/5-amino-6-(5-phosphoribosylamino)uracil reductase RibD [Parapedobacter sp. SGR-10]NGF56126.1 bifunctional diaminohydroxyphosphoribosylaminopyrimidine deaminase/5-amino-6-(5-phosphoribosylamino)uracil reductase RibD [Parapedobacter sp. SGR-10]